MNVSLTPELDKYVHGKVASGRYSSASEVVREALRTMLKRDEVHERAQMQIVRGLRDLEEGRSRVGDLDQIFDEIIDEAEKSSGA